MTKRPKLFGENKGRGVAGVSLLSYGLSARRAKADPTVVFDLVKKDKPKRRVRLRKPKTD